MDSTSTSDNERLLQLIGAIILTSQDVERCLKVTLPFVKSEDASLSAALKRHQKLKRRPLGELVEVLTKSSSSDSPDFELHLDQLVDNRNPLAHHFHDTYGPRIATGRHKEVIASLETQLEDLRNFRTGMQQMALFVLEALRDITFNNAPEYDQMAAVCESFRQRIAS